MTSAKAVHLGWSLGATDAILSFFPTAGRRVLARCSGRGCPEALSLTAGAMLYVGPEPPCPSQCRREPAWR